MSSESLGLIVFAALFTVFFLIYRRIINSMPSNTRKEDGLVSTYQKRPANKNGWVFLVIFAICTLIAIPIIFVNLTAEIISWYKKEPVFFVFIVLFIGGAAFYLYKINEE